eukprot:SAG31_NODE_5257_length_2647_cov_1.852433_1_plen_216_part_00
MDWDEVFSFYDIDRSGELDLAEFRKAIRKGDATTNRVDLWSLMLRCILWCLNLQAVPYLPADAEIRVHQISDEDLASVFREVDEDKAGTVGVDEFKSWLAAGSDDAAAYLAAVDESPSAAAAATMASADITEETEVTALLKVISGPIWHWTLCVCICLSTLCLAFDHYGITDDELQLIDYSNIVFTVIFTVEIVVETVALSPAKYFRCVHDVDIS